MHPAVVAPPPPAPVALAEAREWVGLTTPADDARLAALLSAATEMAEAYLGQALVVRPLVERIAADAGWRALAVRPVRAITGAAAGERALAPDQWAMDIAADGTGRVRVLDAGGVAAVDVGYRAGLAPDPAGVPDAVRHGVLRLAADLYRERDGGPAGPPSAAVTALWRPFRAVRLGRARPSNVMREWAA